MSDTVVTLLCPNHSTFFLDKIWSYYQEKYKVDVEIRSKGQALFAHQLVLSVFCPKLKENLDSDLFSADKLLTVSHVTDDGNLLEILLEFMYRGKVCVERVKLTALKNAASELGIDGLVNAIGNLTKDDDLAITPKKSSARRRKPAKPVKNLQVDETLSEDDDDFDADWSESDEIREFKPSKRTRVGNQETKNANVESEDAKPACATSSKKNNTEKKRQRKRKPTKLAEKKSEIHNCLTCGKTFRNKVSYNRHVMCHADESKLHRCDRCQFSSINKSDLVEHLGSIHMVDLEGNTLTEIKCEQCDYKCFTKQRLKQHILRQHTVKTHKCDKCEYSAVVLCDLVKHIRARHDDVRSYQCDICGKRFKTTSAFNAHSRSHSGIKKYVCAACGQEFAKPESLKFHMMKHEGDKKPFVCHICGKSCRRRDNLQMHFKRIHKINDASCTSLDDTNNSKSTENSVADRSTSESPNTSAKPGVIGEKPPENSVVQQRATAPPDTSSHAEYPGFHNPYIGFVTWMPFSNH